MAIIVPYKFLLLTVLMCSLLSPRSAWAWWEATLQQVDIATNLDQSGHARVAYDLRYHVDRGRFEGVTLSNPGRVIQWDRFASFIEDSHGRRYPVRVMRRGRDGAYLVRLANAPGLRRGWVNVHLEYTDDLMDCCLRLNANDRPRLNWTALTWNVGMDRMTVTVNLDGTTDRPIPDDETASELTIEPVDESGLLIERLRPVRWYELRLGLLLPRDWLQRRPQREVDPPSSTVPVDDGAAPIQAAQTDDTSEQELAGLLFALIGLGCLLLMSLKTWITSSGFRGHTAPAPMLILSKVPPLLRWAVSGSAMLVGAWLQSSSFLAAGTLAFVAGVLLTLRGPVRTNPDGPPRHWKHDTLDALESLASRRPEWRRRWAVVVDGTTWAGIPLTIAALGGGVALLLWIDQTLGRLYVDGAALDLAMTAAALVWTSRRRDTLPCTGRGAASRLLKVSGLLAPSLQRWHSEPRVMISGNETEADPNEVRLTLSPPPQGTKELVVQARRVIGIRGWSSPLQADVVLDDGSKATIVANGPRALTRRLRRRVEHISKRASRA